MMSGDYCTLIMLQYSVVMADGYPTTLDELLGAELRAWRRDREWTQDEMAAHLRAHGLSWSRASVAAAERGAKTFDLGEFVLLCLARGLAPAGWFRDEGNVGLRRDAAPPVLTALALRAVFGGEREADLRWDDLGDLIGVTLPAPQTAPREAETKAAQKFGVTVADVEAAALSLWGRPLTDQREAVIGYLRSDTPATPVTPALRTAVTRLLLRDLGPVVRERARNVGTERRTDPRTKGKEGT